MVSKGSDLTDDIEVESLMLLDSEFYMYDYEQLSGKVSVVSASKKLVQLKFDNFKFSMGDMYVGLGSGSHKTFTINGTISFSLY